MNPTTGPSTTLNTMDSTTDPSTPSTTTTPNLAAIPLRDAFIGIYSVVLLTGVISLSLMMHVMKSGSTSTTSIAIFNLIFTHFIFLFTVPFRLYYYAKGSWDLGHGFCKAVSATIHVHMYMSFLFYVIILVMRLNTFYFKSNTDSFPRLYALIASFVLWVAVFIAVPCVTKYVYGKNHNIGKNNTCFDFGEAIKDMPAKVLNYITSILIIVVAVVLAALQGNVLRILYRKHREGCTFQQEFGAQLKSLVFALIMLVCFIPYHMFRLYYIEHIKDLEPVNEVLLSLTTFNCLDMLTFLGRRTCYRCFMGKL